MSPDEIRDKNLFPYLPLPHVNHPVGGMIFPEMHIKLQPRLERFDMDFDIPEQFLPEFPPAIFFDDPSGHSEMFPKANRHAVRIYSLVRRIAPRVMPLLSIPTI